MTDSNDYGLPTLSASSANMDWRDLAACRAVGNFSFFTASERENAISVCDRCAVADQCLQFAVDNKVKDGVWGGQYFGRKK